MNYLSFDCANRSLAVCYITLNTADIKHNTGKIHILKVIDLTKGAKIDTVGRAILLKKCLCALDTEILDMKSPYNTPNTILIEYQMSVNDKSRCVSNQILYHYSCINNASVHLVGPTLKNKICFSEDDSLSHGVFMEKYASKYTANKNHTKANFLYWLTKRNLNSIIKENKIKKKNIDDVADAFIQIWGWLRFGKSR